MMPVIARSGSRKVNGYVKAVLALEAVRRKARGSVRACRAPIRSQARDALAAEVAMRRRALSGEPLAAAQRRLAMIAQAMASNGAANRG